MKNLTLVTTASSPDLEIQVGSLDLHRWLQTATPGELLQKYPVHCDIHSLIPRRTNALMACKQLLQQTYQKITTALLKEQPFLLLSSDHAASMASWRAALQHYPSNQFGLIWIDSHLRAKTFEQTAQTYLHETSVAALLGKGDTTLNSFYQGERFIPASNIVLIACREYSVTERDLLERSGVMVIERTQINSQEQLEQALAQANEHLSQCQAIGLSVGLNALSADSQTLTANDQGIPLDNMIQALHQWQLDAPLIGMEICSDTPSNVDPLFNQDAALHLMDYYLQRLPSKQQTQQAKAC